MQVYILCGNIKASLFVLFSSPPRRFSAFASPSLIVGTNHWTYNFIFLAHLIIENLLLREAITITAGVYTIITLLKAVS